jgi:hypothetical protein
MLHDASKIRHESKSIHIYATHFGCINGSHIFFLYYFTFFHSLNNSTNFSKYQYHSSNNLNWVPLTPLYIQIMYLLAYKIKKKKCKSKIVQQSTVSTQNHGSNFGHSNSYQLSNTHWHKSIGLCVTTPNVNRYWCSKAL